MQGALGHQVGNEAALARNQRRILVPPQGRANAELGRSRCLVQWSALFLSPSAFDFIVAVFAPRSKRHRREVVAKGTFSGYRAAARRQSKLLA